MPHEYVSMPTGGAHDYIGFSNSRGRRSNAKITRGVLVPTLARLEELLSQARTSTKEGTIVTTNDAMEMDLDGLALAKKRRVPGAAERYAAARTRAIEADEEQELEARAVRAERKEREAAEQARKEQARADADAALAGFDIDIAKQRGAIQDAERRRHASRPPSTGPPPVLARSRASPAQRRRARARGGAAGVSRRACRIEADSAPVRIICRVTGEQEMRVHGSVTMEQARELQAALERCPSCRGPIEGRTPPETEQGVWLAPIHSRIRPQALAALEAGDAELFLGSADNMDGPILVAMNSQALRERGIYEAAVLRAVTMPRMNNHRAWTCVVALLHTADRERLRAAGDPLPGPGPFLVYRGVAGRGPARRIRGFSWTGSLERARWFAERGQYFNFHDPAVYSVTVGAHDVLAYVHEGGRKEEEFIVMLPAAAKPVRVE